MVCKEEQLLKAYEDGKLSRRGFLGALAAVSAVKVSAATQPNIQVTSINHVTMFVKDIPKTVEFYQKMFGLEVLSKQGDAYNMATGKTGQFLGFYGGTANTEVDIHHVCLGIKNFDVESLVARLKEFGITAQVRMRDGSVPEIYFIDPNGIRIQLQDESYCGGSGTLGNQCN